MICFRSLTYSYPKRSNAALFDINLEIDRGEFLLVSGPSGSGKSTFLRTINGLVPHFSGGQISGQVTVKDLDVIEEGPQALSRHIGFVSQNPEDQTLFETVEPEIAFVLENAAVPTAEMHQRVSTVLDLLGLTALRSRAINTLSGGERQRVAIACALALNPDILVLDEPTSQLDPEAAGDLLRSLQTLNKEFDLTVVLCEHRLERVLPFADRMASFADGRLQWVRPVRSGVRLIEHPPPLIDIARKLAWDPIPLTPEEGASYIGGSLAGSAWQAEPPDDDTVSEEQPARPLLSVRDIHFSYSGGQEALRSVSFNLQRGEILAVLGSNGSGKSTLLRCLIGLLTPSQGEIEFEGRSIMGADTAELAQEIAFLPQNPDDLLFAETVTQECEITLRNHGLAAGGRIEQMLEILGLTSEAGTYPRDLSTGQRQRVALGAVTITEPSLLMLDEPTRGLDVRLKQELAAVWQRWRGAGKAIIIVTHDVELVAQMADNVLVLDHGMISAYGSARDVLTGSPSYAPQTARLFPGTGWLTPEEALIGLSKKTELAN